MIGVGTGDDYDFWKVQDGLDKVEKRLQQQGYVFPRTEVQQTKASANSLNIQVSVDAREKRSVLFQGYRVTKHQKQKYDAFWREGFSEEGVLELIREDLLRGLWFDGYQKATVRRDTTSANGLLYHTFTMTPGPLYKNVQRTRAI